MTGVPEAQPTPPDATQKSKRSDKQQAMERVQEQAAEERASEGGHQ